MDTAINHNTFYNGQSLLSRLKDLQADLPHILRNTEGDEDNAAITLFWTSIKDDHFSDSEITMICQTGVRLINESDEYRRNVTFYTSLLNDIMKSLNLID